MNKYAYEMIACVKIQIPQTQVIFPMHRHKKQTAYSSGSQPFTMHGPKYRKYTPVPYPTNEDDSWDASDSIVTTLMYRRPRFDSRHHTGFLFAIMSGLALTQPPTVPDLIRTEGLSTAAKRHEGAWGEGKGGGTVLFIFDLGTRWG
jgi:hypothetical protein